MKTRMTESLSFCFTAPKLKSSSVGYKSAVIITRRLLLATQKVLRITFLNSKIKIY